VQEPAEKIGSSLVADLPRSDTVFMAEEQAKTVVEAFPESEMAACYRKGRGPAGTLPYPYHAGNDGCPGYAAGDEVEVELLNPWADIF